MDERTKNPIELMANLLAEMTARAMEAERQRDEALKSSEEWYQNYLRKDIQVKDLQRLLDDKTNEYERLRISFSDYVDKLKEEEREHERCTK